MIEVNKEEKLKSLASVNTSAREDSTATLGHCPQVRLDQASKAEDISGKLALQEELKQDKTSEKDRSKIVQHEQAPSRPDRKPNNDEENQHREHREKKSENGNKESEGQGIERDGTIAPSQVY